MHLKGDPRILALLLTALAGCGSSTHVVPLTPAENRLTKIAMAYADAEDNLGHPPKNADELKPFLKTFGNPEELLVSPNDGKPFVVVWGKKLAGGPTEYKNMFPILAYEQSGSSRAVTDIRGRPMTVPEADLDQLRYLGGHKPAPK
jgi:hypothetical protein